MLRLMRAPNWRVDILKPRSGAAGKLRRPPYRRDDVGVAGAAAEIAREHQLADAVVGQVELFAGLEMRADVHDHARRAVAALQRMAFLERLLQRAAATHPPAAALSIVRISAPCGLYREGQAGAGRPGRRSARCRRRKRRARSRHACR